MQEPGDADTKNLVKIKLLVMVAIADHHWDEREVAMLEALADKTGLDRAELSRVRDKPDFDVKELAAGLPADNAERIQLLADLIMMAYADRKLHENELQLLVKLGRLLGFDEDAVRAIIAEEG